MLQYLPDRNSLILAELGRNSFVVALAKPPDQSEANLDRGREFVF